MNDIWNSIANDYEEAKKCLWCPKNSGVWYRDEDKGMYHLWRAYFEAVQATTKDDLLYARVLMMMNDEQHNLHEYTRFHKYIAPAKEAYERAIQRGNNKLTKKKSRRLTIITKA